MDFAERLETLSKRIPQIAEQLKGNEEATKTALVLPFLQSVLGYDIFNPDEVMPEFTTDIGTKKGEKVDYALKIDGEIKILIECKPIGDPLEKHTGQLFRYFSVTKARLGILTDGVIYKLYTDLSKPNIMDDYPFLTLNLLDIDEHIVPEVKKITKSTFNIESIVDSAGELKYLNKIKRVLKTQFEAPEEDFVKFFASRVYDGQLTQKVKLQFTEITQKALKQFMKDSINKRLQSAIEPNEPSEETVSENKAEARDSNNIVTIELEIEGYNIVKSILRQYVDVARIAQRDRQSYFGILLDNNNRKPLCRLYFNTKQMYIAVFNKDKEETKIAIESVDDIFNHSAELVKTLKTYEL